MIAAYTIKNPSTMTPAVIFGALNIAASIAGYFGLIESVAGRGVD